MAIRRQIFVGLRREKSAQKWLEVAIKIASGDEQVFDRRLTL
jgi:hypothetical protein